MWAVWDSRGDSPRTLADAALPWAWKILKDGQCEVSVLGQTGQESLQMWLSRGPGRAMWIRFDILILCPLVWFLPVHILPLLL